MPERRADGGCGSRLRLIGGIENFRIEPFAKGHARPARRILRGFAGFWLDALYTPRNSRFHSLFHFLHALGVDLASFEDESQAPEFLPSLEVNVFGKYSVKYLFFSCIYHLTASQQLDSLCPIHPRSPSSEILSTAAPTKDPMRRGSRGLLHQPSTRHIHMSGDKTFIRDGKLQTFKSANAA